MSQAEPRWQAAARELLQAAEHGGPFVMIARIAVSRAVHGITGVELPPAPRVTSRTDGRPRERSGRSNADYR